MLSKKQKNNHSVSSKTIFKTYSPLCLLLNQLKQILPSLQQLLSISALNHCNLEQIIEILQDFPKTFERNISLLNEHSVFQQLAEMIENLLLAKKQRKYKPYHLFTNWKIGQEILIRRIRQGIKGNMEQAINQPKNFILYNFISEIEHISASIQKWAKFKTSKNLSQIQQTITFLYADRFSSSKTISPADRQTAVSSACISRDKSYQQKNPNDQSKDLQKSKHKILQRSSTAKPSRQQIKFTTRCPSANQLLAECFKKPILQARKPIKRVLMKSTDFDAKNKKLSSKNSKYNKFLSSCVIQENEESAKNRFQASNTRNISILNKSFQNGQENCTNPNQMIQKKIQEVHSSLHFINHFDVNQNDEEMQEINRQAMQIQHNEELKTNEIVRTQQRKRTGNYAKKRENNSGIISESKRGSVQSIEKLSRHQIKIKKGKTSYKAPRKSVKLSIRSIESIKNQVYQTPVKKQASNFTRRRKAMLSQKKMNEIQQIIDESNNQGQQRKIQFQENVLLALADAIKVQKPTQRKQQLQKPQNQLGFQYRYTQLNKFVKSSQFNQSQSHISTFFEQQEQIKKAEDMVMKQKMKALMKKQNFTNIFEISCSVKNNKDTIYNQIERRLSFFSDQEWIKQALDHRSTLQQKNL